MRTRTALPRCEAVLPPPLSVLATLCPFPSPFPELYFYPQANYCCPQPGVQVDQLDLLHLMLSLFPITASLTRCYCPQGRTTPFRGHTHTHIIISAWSSKHVKSFRSHCPTSTRSARRVGYELQCLQVAQSRLCCPVACASIQGRCQCIYMATNKTRRRQGTGICAAEASTSDSPTSSDTARREISPSSSTAPAVDWGHAET